MKSIPMYKNFKTITPITKGWSNDKKYYIETTDNCRLMLRISDISEYETKKTEYNLICSIAKQDIPMPKPIDFGICHEGKNTYMLITWVDGKDAEEVLRFYSEKEQYEFGIKAGKILRKIHSIPINSNLENWETRYNRKIDRKIENYKKCGIKIQSEEKIFSYIKQNRYLLSNRPQVLQHGDYHTGNMIISSNNVLSVIDFNRLDYGDPWEEFNRIVWCAACSKYFASGRINGYFDNNVPLDFFNLLALYISCNTLSSIYWAIPFGQSEIEVMLRQAQEVLQYFNSMTNPIPSWYIKSL